MGGVMVMAGSSEKSRGPANSSDVANVRGPEVRDPVADSSAKGAKAGNSNLLPTLSLPKGGGAIRGIGEKFTTNPVTGTGSLSVPIATSPGRGGFGPGLSLSYDSGSGNAPFGIGWTLSTPSITRKTDKGLPRYFDGEESDVFVLSGAEDLVPARLGDGADAPLDAFERDGFLVQRYRPRTEGLFARIERWRHATTGDTHWQATTRDNVLNIYGRSSEARIADPEDPASHVFSWLLEETRDDRGNVARYTYKAENGAEVDPGQLSEASRFEVSPNGTRTFIATAQRYLRRIQYGNRTVLLDRTEPAPTKDEDYLFEVVLDYGEYAAPDDPDRLAAPEPVEVKPWSVRQDPVSSYRAGFEVRTYRLCRRVLMFHRFPELGEGAVLVRSMDFEYEENALVTYLKAVRQAGYKREPASSGLYERALLPPLELDYARPIVHDELRSIDRESLEGIPVGVEGTGAQWVDLDGEGIPGVLIPTDRAWFYKSNRGEGHLSPPSVLRTLPSPAELGSGLQQLTDLGSDGNLDLLQYTPPLSGYFERTQEGGWAPFVALRSLPNINWNDPNLRFLDLDGDGLPDVLITEHEAFVWYRSRGRDGFDPASLVTKPKDELKGAAVVFADGTETIQLADMSGDGLTDIVRVRNGEVCYWPNLGYGRFGRKVTLAKSPWFDHPDQFDPKRAHFADIDGSGTSDIVYLGRDGVRLYINQAGNSLSNATPIDSLPPVDSASHLSVMDLLGQGTACLVWSSPLPGNQSRPVLYVDLMGGKKPHVLELVVNNLGAETHVTYAPSTKFYLKDKAEGRPWLTRLAFPVHVIEQVEHVDAISNSRHLTTYSYRHGFFDGVEREFRGFACVEQLDTEVFTVGASGTEMFQAPVRTVSWFHTGAWLERERLEAELSKEYFQGSGGPLLLRDTILPTGLSIQDEREAARALRGSMLRQEIYADDEDGTGRSKRPFVTTEQNFELKLLQSSKGAKHGVFFVHPRESVTVHSERNPDDPRVTHELVIEVDEFGNLKRKVAIAYPRASGEPEQKRSWVTLTETDYINRDDQQVFYRVGVQFEERVFELTGLALPASGQGLIALSALHNDQGTGKLDTLDPADDIPYDGTASGLGVQRRLLDRKQQLFYKNDLTGPLPLGQLESLALPYETYQLALTPGLVNELVTESHTLSGNAFDPTLLVSEGHYVQRDSGYWTASGLLIFDPARFYLPVKAIDPFGHAYFTTYDDYALLVTSTKDPLDNLVQVENNYRVLSPAALIDLNLNRTEVEFDALGMVVRTAVMGKHGEGDTLDNAAAHLETTRLEYDLHRWKAEQKPAFVHTFARELHGPTNPRFQETFTYSDGFGRVAMQKVQAEPGDAPLRDAEGSLLREPDRSPVVGHVNARWVGTGRTVFNNKGNAVKQFEPFFSSTSEFEDEPDLVEWGVTPIVHYDPLDRVVRIELPDGSESRVEFDVWWQRSFDPNDAVLGTRWLTEHQAGTADEQRAAKLALAHADTPTLTHVDALGRAFLVQADKGPNTMTLELRLLDTRSVLDVEGHVLSVTDPRRVVVQQQRFDVLQRTLRVESADAGIRLAIADVAGKPLRAWDNRGQMHRQRYDALQRATHVYVHKGGAERLVLRTVYGEALDPDGPPPTDPNLASPGQKLNLRGRPHQAFDCAGLMVHEEFDFKGNVRLASRRLAVDYTSEPNWTAAQDASAPAAVLAQVGNLLENETFSTETTHDALNRVVTHKTPDQSVQRPVFNEANLLESLQVSVRGEVEQAVIRNIDYNARGQRVLCEYENGTSTEYTYDANTFRLKELLTLRGSTKLQHLVYTYDPVGNIVALRDRADTAPFFGVTTPVSGDGVFEYDPLYRVTSATGREHPGTQPVDTDRPPGTSIPHRNDLQALQGYTERYRYDDAGNIEQVAHRAGPSGTNGWTRNYLYAATSNRLLATSHPGSESDVSLPYTYDEHGSMTSMPHLQAMEWDYADRLQRTRPINGADPQDTYFTYDAGGERVRKVFVHNGSIKERIYLGGYEIFRKRPTNPEAAIEFERQTLHLMDDQRRVAMVETKAREDREVIEAPTSRWRFHLDNHLGSAAIELDVHGNVISYEEYHPYGSTAFQITDGNAEISAKRYRYTGKERDDETGLYYHGARYYACWLGRWTSADPAGMVDGPNLYAYGSANPVRFTDPSGMDPAEPFDERTATTYGVDENAQEGAIDEWQIDSEFNVSVLRHPIKPVQLEADTIRGSDPKSVEPPERTGTTTVEHVQPESEPSTGELAWGFTKGVVQGLLPSVPKTWGEAATTGGLLVLAPLYGGPLLLLQAFGVGSDVADALNEKDPRKRAEAAGKATGGAVSIAIAIAGLRSPKAPSIQTSKVLLQGELEYGPYGRIAKVGDSLTPHHMPSSAYMQEKFGIGHRQSLAMNVEHPPSPGGRHRGTETYGRQPFLDELPRDALARDIADLRRIYQREGLYGPTVRRALQGYIDLSKKTFPKIFGATQTPGAPK